MYDSSSKNDNFFLGVNLEKLLENCIFTKKNKSQ